MPFSFESSHGKWRPLATKGFQKLQLSQQPEGSVVQTLLFLLPAEHPEGREVTGCLLEAAQLVWGRARIRSKVSGSQSRICLVLWTLKAEVVPWLSVLKGTLHMYPPVYKQALGDQSPERVTLFNQEIVDNEPKSESESEVAQSCPTLCDPMDCSLPVSSFHGIFQATVLEWVAISFSRASSRPRDPTRMSHIVGRRFTVWATREVRDYIKDYSWRKKL